MLLYDKLKVIRTCPFSFSDIDYTCTNPYGWALFRGQSKMNLRCPPRCYQPLYQQDHQHCKHPFVVVVILLIRRRRRRRLVIPVFKF